VVAPCFGGIIIHLIGLTSIGWAIARIWLSGGLMGEAFVKIFVAAVVAAVTSCSHAHARSLEVGALNDYCFAKNNEQWDQSVQECINGYWDGSFITVVCEVHANMRNLKGLRRTQWVQRCVDNLDSNEEYVR